MSKNLNYSAMFPKEVYQNRRNKLKKLMLDKGQSGIILFLGNRDVPFNYTANIYPFRQDSNFLYFFGIDKPDLAAIIDLDNDQEIIFGDELTIDDIIWMGNMPSISELANQAGVYKTRAITALEVTLKQALKQKRNIHFLPPYRGEIKHWLQLLLGIEYQYTTYYASVPLIESVVALRETKDQYEIAEIERAVHVAYQMHTTAMKMAKPGVKEQQIAGTIQGISLSHEGPVSFPVIVTVNGQILHNTSYDNILQEGQLLLVDAGAESRLHYASDITRTTPVGGKFNQRQKDIYQIVLEANKQAIEAIKPGKLYRDIHLLAARIIAQGLKDLGLLDGSVNDIVEQGAHALFFPHGLGHMLGLDVHDMEGLGENYVGYNSTVKRSSQFGLAFLRLAKELKPGFVLTVEPGIYFIPELIDLWRREGKFVDFINYDKVESFKDFGGIRIEDDVLVTDSGSRVLGIPIPKEIEQVEAICNES